MSSYTPIHSKEEQEVIKENQWQELMGGDLILLQHGVRNSSSDNISSSEAISDKNSFPNVGDAIRISFTGCILGSDDIYAGELLKDLPLVHDVATSFYLNAQNWVVTLGDADLLPALEMGVRFLRENHIGIVRCHSKYAHGSQGWTCSPSGHGSQGWTCSPSGPVPPNSSVEFCITIHEILRPSEENSLEIDLQRALWKKRIGSDFYFNDAAYKKALQLYKSSSDILQSILTISQQNDEEAPEDAKQLLTDVLNNTALCYMKMSDYLKAKQSCTDALQHDPTNIKALCRAAKCCIMLGQYEEASACLDTAHKQNSATSPSNADGSKSIQQMTRLLKQAKTDYRQKEKDMYRKMVAGMVGEGKQHGFDAADNDNKINSIAGTKPNIDDGMITRNSFSSIMSHATKISLAIPLLVALVSFVWFKYTAAKN